MKVTNGQHKAPWIIRTYAGFGSPEETNKRFLSNLQNGQTGVSVAFDLPTQNGFDPDDEMSRGEIGGCGVSIAHLGDMRNLFEGIDLAEANTSMTINSTSPFVLALYLVLAEEKGIPWTALRGTVQNDMMKEFVARGTSIFSPSTSLQLSTDIITFTAQYVPKWNPINICGYHYMESGARPHEEIGYAFGNAMLILDNIKPHLDENQFRKIAERISFFINSGIELIPEICKVRAYSHLWKEICRSEYGIEDIEFRAGCQVRSLGLTASQPENNIVLIALEALPVLLSADARVNALQLPGFREALSLPDQMEQHLSLRIQQILMHETRLAEYADIFDGNPTITSLTNTIEADALTIALRIRRNGYDNAIAQINSELIKAMIDRQHRIDTKEDIVVGVNEYLEPVGLSEQLPQPPPTTQDTEFEQRRVIEIRKWRTNRDQAKWSEARSALIHAARNKADIMPASIEFARAGGTVGEWTSAIEVTTSGRYNLPLNLNAVQHKRTIDPSLKDVRIVLGKAGLDGHTNAIKLIAIACRDAGMEVIFTGIKAKPAMLVKCAIEEDAGLLGVSCLSGAHVETARSILEAKRNLGATTLKCIMGGIIPDHDVHDLLDMGIDLVIQSGNGTLDDSLRKIKELVEAKKSVPVGQL